MKILQQLLAEEALEEARLDKYTAAVPDSKGNFAVDRGAMRADRERAALAAASTSKIKVGGIHRKKQSTAPTFAVVHEVTDKHVVFTDHLRVVGDTIRPGAHKNDKLTLGQFVKQYHNLPEKASLKISEALALPQYAIKRLNGQDFEVTKFDGGKSSSAQYQVTKLKGNRFSSDSPGYHKSGQEEKSVRLVKQFLKDGEPMGAMYEVAADGTIKQIKGLR